MTTTRTASLADRLERATAGCPDVDALSAAVFAVVAQWVPFTFACLATTDPATQLITTAVKSHPLDLGDEDFSAAEYGPPDVNQFAELAARPVPVGALSLDTDGHPETCRRFREFMAPAFGFTDELRVACRSRDIMWGALAFYRGPGEPPFTAAEAALVGGVHEVVATRIRQVLFAPAGPAADRNGPAVMVIDGDDRVTDVTDAVQHHVEDLGGWDGASLPANVLAVAALARTRGALATARVKGRSGGWLALQAMPLAGAPGARRSVVVTVDDAAPSAIGPMTLAARGLTARETDVAQLVLQGASTKDIAEVLHLSPHTVQDHLKSVFGKLGVASRREMIATLTT
ncbi:helix-turn-helix transcriptional regulator [Jatrophihabitans sp. YIM 134969]